jgi:glycosyltransferase involved in cell wall biosynthesis
MKSVLFYSDASDYGGHEVMTVKAVGHLCLQANLRVTFAFYRGNRLLTEKLELIKASSQNLDLLPLDDKGRTLQAVRSLISWRKVRRLTSLMRQVNPDVVIVAQGRIEGGTMGLLAAKRAGYRTLSYLPVAHPVSVSGRPFAIWIREKINRYFYRLPDKIITISESAQRMLRERGATPNVVVVPNAVEVPPIDTLDRQTVRQAHGLANEDYVVATIGRIHFRDKGQDFALTAIARFRDRLGGCKFIFVGEGPDQDALKRMIANLHLSERVRIIPWTPNPAEIYAAIDMLMIPSRHEGVPLVMLEAMAYGLPIVATNVDGMADLLPPDWLFPFGDCRELVDTLARVSKSTNPTLLESHRNKIKMEFTNQKFGLNLRAAVFE